MCDHPTIVLGATLDDAEEAIVQYDLNAYLVPMTIGAAIRGGGRGITAQRVVSTIPAQVDPAYADAIADLVPCTVAHPADCRWTRPGPR